MESTFLGYAAFYLVRNNLSVVAKDIEGALHYDHSMIGSVSSYGLHMFLWSANGFVQGLGWPP